MMSATTCPLFSGFGLKFGGGVSRFVLFPGTESILDLHAQGDCQKYVDGNRHCFEKSVHNDVGVKTVSVSDCILSVSIYKAVR